MLHLLLLLTRPNATCSLCAYFMSCAQMSSQLLDPSNPDDQQFWDHLLQDTAQSGAHDPQGEVLFPAFCESLVRIAAVRYAPALQVLLGRLLT